MYIVTCHDRLNLIRFCTEVPQSTCKLRLLNMQVSLVISAKLAAALHAQLIQTQCPRNIENSMCIKNQAEPYVHLYNDLMQPSVGLPSCFRTVSLTTKP